MSACTQPACRAHVICPHVTSDQGYCPHVGALTVCDNAEIERLRAIIRQNCNGDVVRAALGNETSVREK